MKNRDIAKQLNSDYHNGRYSFIDDEYRIEFSIGRLTIRCKNTREAVQAVIARYSKPLPNGGKSTPWPPRARSGGSVSIEKAFMGFWVDEEYDNAMAYLRNIPRDKWPPNVIALLTKDQPKLYPIAA